MNLLEGEPEDAVEMLSKLFKHKFLGRTVRFDDGHYHVEGRCVMVVYDPTGECTINILGVDGMNQFNFPTKDLLEWVDYFLVLE